MIDIDAEKYITKSVSIIGKNYLNTYYINQPINEIYAVDGICNKGNSIAHYCSLDVFEQILKNKCLRFSDVAYLNDTTEFKEAVGWIKICVQNEKYKKDFRDFLCNKDFIESLSDYKQSYIGRIEKKEHYEEIIYRTYVCCLSTNVNSLNMWNYYGKNGVSVIFKSAYEMFDWEKNEITKTNYTEKRNNGIIMDRGLVIYNNDDKNKCIISLIDDIYELYLSVESEIEKYKESIYNTLKTAFNNIRCFLKNENYYREEEYRFTIRVPENVLLLRKEELNEYQIYDKGFFKRGSILIPYIDYKVNTDFIKAIISNPYIKRYHNIKDSYPKENDDIFITCLQDLLWHYYCKDVAVHESGIPMRKYD